MAFDLSGFHQFDFGADTQYRRQFLFRLFDEGTLLFHLIKEDLLVDFDLHFQGIHIVDPVDNQLIMGFAPFDLEQNLFDLGRKNIDSFDN